MTSATPTSSAAAHRASARGAGSAPASRDWRHACSNRRSRRWWASALPSSVVPGLRLPGSGSRDQTPGPTRRARATRIGPPAATRSRASFASRSAVEFCALGTCVADQRLKPASIAFASDQSGCSLASLTRQRPCSCSTMSFESRNRSTLSAPRRWASSSARTTPVHSATLLVWWPSASEIVASGGAAGSRASTREPSISAAPSDAGPGFPLAAPSVRMMRCGMTGSAGSPGALRRAAPRSSRTPRGSPG